MNIHEPGAVTIDRDGSVALIRVANPPLNLLTRSVLEELAEAFTELDHDRTCRAVVLTSGIDGLFLTHLDVYDVLGRPVTPWPVAPLPARVALAAVGLARRSTVLRRRLAASRLAGLDLLLVVHELLERIQRSSMVTVAALNGSAVGPGFDVALAFDLRVAAAGPFEFGMPESTLGGIPGAGATQRLTHMLGPARSLEFLLEGTTLSPLAALELGLVNRVVEPPDALIASALRTAGRLARRSPATVAALKRAVYQSASRALRAGLRDERGEFVALLSRGDVREALEALEAFGAECRPDEGISPWLSPGGLERWRSGEVVRFSAHAETRRDGQLGTR